MRATTCDSRSVSSTMRADSSFSRARIASTPTARCCSSDSRRWQVVPLLRERLARLAGLGLQPVEVRGAVGELPLLDGEPLQPLLDGVQAAAQHLVGEPVGAGECGPVRTRRVLAHGLTTSVEGCLLLWRALSAAAGPSAVKSAAAVSIPPVEVLDEEALVRRVDVRLGQREAAEDRVDALLRERRHERDRAADARQQRAHAERLLERVERRAGRQARRRGRGRGSSRPTRSRARRPRARPRAAAAPPRRRSSRRPGPARGGS